MRVPARMMMWLWAAIAWALLATVCASSERVRLFRDEHEFMQAAASHHMQVARFALTRENVLSASELFSSRQDIKLGDFADLRRELTFTEQVTDLGFGFGLSKLDRLERNAFALDSKAGLSLGGRQDDDFAVFFRTRSLEDERAARAVYGVGWRMEGDENMSQERLGVHNLFGETIWYGPVVGAPDTTAAAARGTNKGHAGGAGDGKLDSRAFVGVLADEPISEIRFDEDDDAAEHVIVQELVFATREAHVLDAVTPFGRAMFWVVFNLFVVAMLCVDFMCADSKSSGASRAKFRGAALWTVLWICLALVFDGALWAWHGRGPAFVWLTSYLLEKFLSVDNLFVFLTIFNSFKTPIAHQYKVLLWGIVGAIALRTVFIVAGVILLEKFAYLMVLFGLFLVYTGIKLLREGDDDKGTMDTHETLRKNIVIRIFKKFVPVTAHYDPDGAFFVPVGKMTDSDYRVGASAPPSVGALRAAGAKWAATPLFIVLLVIETTDVVFAIDSIPAVLSITADSFIAYTSNIFAILGLRALYFCLAAAMHMFHYLPLALSFILIFIGAKMLMAFLFGVHISVELALLIVVGSLGAAVLASIHHRRRQTDLLPI